MKISNGFELICPECGADPESDDGVYKMKCPKCGAQMAINPIKEQL